IFLLQRFYKCSLLATHVTTRRASQRFIPHRAPPSSLPIAQPEHPPMPHLPELTSAEWSIMQFVWERGEILAREIHEALEGPEGWAPTTVRTMLDRLARKGYLRAKRVGPVYLYSAAVDRKGAVRHSFKDLLNRLKPAGTRDLI